MDSNVDTYYFKGILYDSLSGNPLQGKTVYLNYGGPAIVGSETMQTDLNGEFIGSISWSSIGSRYGSPPSMENTVYISAIHNSLAGFRHFKYGDLSLSETLQVNIYLNPVGYLNLHLVDTSHAHAAEINCSHVVDTTKTWHYYAINAGYADTTFTFKIFNNSKVYIALSYYQNNIWNATYDSALVNSNDSVTKTISF